MKQYCVYILSSKTKVLYIGVTGNLPRRIYEHKNKLIDGFTKKLEREKQLKKWRREKKINLIEKINPNWLDLADNL
ncbi:MAG: Excinuclease ABC subunit C [Candidatus Moranbacteria bacterium GW2011_GWE2_35_164]|nr:MAG: Excinuclease ABC subunit C [Candidatus Moranbacteria bacterium GW2011_GWE2_35_164]